jgi:hypothetical protein
MPIHHSIKYDLFLTDFVDKPVDNHLVSWWQKGKTCGELFFQQHVD